MEKLSLCYLSLEIAFSNIFILVFNHGDSFLELVAINLRCLFPLIYAFLLLHAPILNQTSD